MTKINYTFGPVPSRRLGRSLGINNIPPKICSYACVYCQLGNTIRLTDKRDEFYDYKQIFEAVKAKVNSTLKAGEKIDFLTVVPDGEPTLDVNLELLAIELKKLKIPLAIITNSSHLHLEQVRKALLHFDWVSVKIDSVKEKTWRKIDRPFGKIALNDILLGIKTFAGEFNGTLATETMLVKSINDSKTELEATADFISHIKPDIAYISVPTRPPAENFVLPPDEKVIIQAHDIFSSRIPKVELNISYEGGDFISTDSFEEDFLSIISVHPMREEAVKNLLNQKGENFNLIENLIKNGTIVRKIFNNNVYYLRNLRKK